MELRRTEKPVKIQKKTMAVKLTGTGRDRGGRVDNAPATVEHRFPTPKAETPTDSIEGASCPSFVCGPKTRVG